MLYLIAYDIPNDKRRTKIHKTLCGFGTWTQYSIFECFLNEKELITLQHRLRNILNEKEDNIRIYPLCAACQAKTETIGSSPPAEDTLYLL
ncbi:MAG: CRISPR-associated endonuclease Cas2 [Chloroflexi bacterium]|nr:CRISPR-associated endonuclease Cas2 [Chloroflexota bacterium]